MKSNKWRPKAPRCQQCAGKLADYSAIDGVMCEEACTNPYCSLYGQEQCQEYLDHQDAILAYFGGPDAVPKGERDDD